MHDVIKWIYEIKENDGKRESHTLGLRKGEGNFLLLTIRSILIQRGERDQRRKEKMRRNEEKMRREKRKRKRKAKKKGKKERRNKKEKNP